MYDLIIRGGSIAVAGGIEQMDIGVKNGVICDVGKDLGDGMEAVNGEGLVIMPGLIDPHVHFNEPGRTEWETIACGSSAFAAGGGTLFFDMPLNSFPCVISRKEFEAKEIAMRNSAYTDYGLWGGLTPLNLDRLQELAFCGVIGFKAFLCATGINDLPHVDEESLKAGMARIAETGLPLMVHCESDEITGRLTRAALEQGRLSARDYLDSRPVEAELESIEMAIRLAGMTGCRLAIAHVSSVEGVRLVLDAQKKGVDVVCETTASYLTLNEEDVIRIGTTAKCSPPLRTEANRSGLWDCVQRGEIHFVSSDHSPCEPELKEQAFLKAWGGISSCQSTLNCLLTEGYHKKGVELNVLVKALSENPANYFGISGKGAIAPGYDCDLVFVDLNSPYTLEKQHLYYKHPVSPYIGHRFQGQIVRTMLRGKSVFINGSISEAPTGRLVKPAALVKGADGGR